jgi:hypothetical protein
MAINTDRRCGDHSPPGDRQLRLGSDRRGFVVERDRPDAKAVQEALSLFLSTSLARGLQLVAARAQRRRLWSQAKDDHEAGDTHSRVIDGLPRPSSETRCCSSAWTHKASPRTAAIGPATSCRQSAATGLQRRPAATRLRARARALVTSARGPRQLEPSQLVVEPARPARSATIVLRPYQLHCGGTEAVWGRQWTTETKRSQT